MLMFFKLFFRQKLQKLQYFSLGIGGLTEYSVSAEYSTEYSADAFGQNDLWSDTRHGRTLKKVSSCNFEDHKEANVKKDG
jgi:hypothetical protein